MTTGWQRIQNGNMDALQSRCLKVLRQRAGVITEALMIHHAFFKALHHIHPGLSRWAMDALC